MSLKETMMGSKPSLKKMETLNRGQRKLLDALTKGDFPQTAKNPMYQSGIGYLQQLLGHQPQDRYAQLEAPYMRQFNEEIMPGIAEQFGGAGALSSSGFQNATSNAGGGLMERLAALNLGQQNAFRGQQLSALPMAQSYAQQPFSDFLNRTQTALGTQPFGYQNIQGQSGLGQSIMSSMGSGLGTGIGSALGGLAGSALGPLGTWAGSALGGWLGGNSGNAAQRMFF